MVFIHDDLCAADYLIFPGYTPVTNKQNVKYINSENLP